LRARRNGGGKKRQGENETAHRRSPSLIIAGTASTGHDGAGSMFAKRCEIQM
jgi:hypothetical protein